MDFGAEDIGPYDPYMDFLLENLGRATKKRPSDGEVGPENSQIQILTRNPKFQNGHIYSFHAPKDRNIGNSPKRLFSVCSKGPHCNIEQS